MSKYSINVPCKCSECDSKLENGFKLSEHLIKLHQHSIHVLPPQVIEKILGYVSPAGLAELNQTCRMLKRATEEHVQCKRRCGEVTILCGDFEILILSMSDTSEYGNYENTFKFLIPNIKVHLADKADSVSGLFEFIRDKCPQRYVHFKFTTKHFFWKDCV